MLGGEHLTATPPEIPLTQRDPEIFVSPADEDRYCADNHIELYRAGNGATVMTMPFTVQDAVEASLYLYFPTGSIHDPPQKSGTLHMYEHLAANNPGVLARHYETIFNAGTSPSHLEFKLAGLANPQVREIGIWPIIPLLAHTLYEPEQMTIDLEHAVAVETGNVVNEISLKYASHQFRADLFNQQVTLSPDNPVLMRAFGTPEDVANITAADILAIAHQSVIPRGMVAAAITSEYNMPVHKTVFDELRRLVDGFPRADKHPLSTNRAVFERTNPAFTPGAIYTRDTGITNGKITISYLWVMQCEPYSIDNYALETIVGFMDNGMNQVIRANGLSYNPGASTITPGEQTVICTAEFTIDKTSDYEQIASMGAEKILPRVFGLVDTQRIQGHLQREALRRKAVPKSVQGRYSFAKTGLQQYGQMMNFDALADRPASATLAHFQRWQDYFLTVPPAITIVGDLANIK